MMSRTAQRRRGGARARPGVQPYLHPGPRVAVIVVLTTILLGTGPMCAAEEGVDISTGVGISITRIIRIRLASPFEPNPRYVTWGEDTTSAEPAPGVESAEISVATNTTDWGVLVRFKLPPEGKRKLRDAVARCRLVDQEGKIISERFIDGDEVFLEGNGRRGNHTLFLEVSGHAEAFGIETLTEPMVDVEGWSADGGM